MKTINTLETLQPKLTPDQQWLRCMVEIIAVDRPADNKTEIISKGIHRLNHQEFLEAVKLVLEDGSEDSSKHELVYDLGIIDEQKNEVESFGINFNASTVTRFDGNEPLITVPLGDDRLDGDIKSFIRRHNLTNHIELEWLT